jgi:predicted metallopeptidase
VPRYSRSNKGRLVEWKSAPDVKRRINFLIENLQLGWLSKNLIYCVRSTGTNTRALSRIWGLGRIWQITLKEKPSYIIEVISERYDRLGEMEQDKVLLHEIAHIPQNFSGSLLPHTRRGKNKFYDRVRILVAQYLNSK